MSFGWWVAGALGVMLIAVWLRLRNVLARVRRLSEHVFSGEPIEQDQADIDVEPGPVAVLEERVAEALREKESAAGEKRSREELFTMIANGLSDGILVADTDLKLTLSNRGLRGLFPSGKFMEGTPLIEAVRDHRIVDLANEAFRQGGTVTSEFTIEGTPRSEGSHESVYAIESAPIAQDGEPVVWMVVRDVTDRVMTEQIRRDFVANASHELRTPLTLINGYIENLLDGAIEDREMAEKSLRVMDKHGKRIVRIVEDMLTISKLESRKDAVNVEPFDIAECVTDVIDNLAVPIEEKKATVEFVSEEEDRAMLGDRFYWDQIFINLIENALKENVAPGLRIEVGFRTEGDVCVIWVADDGVGISADQLPFVFKRFYRGAKHHSKKVQGTGLGLSIVKRAVEAHGGTIELKSTPGVRTEFTMRVPQN